MAWERNEMDINTLWFSLIGAAFYVYMVLDGFDFGVGMLLPFMPKDGSARRDALSSMWPVWDGNELWGLIAAGASFAVFPAVFAGLLPLVYPFAFILMACLILRPLAFEMWFREAAPGSRAVWEKVFAIGGALAAFIVGDLLGLLVAGLPFSGPDPYGASLAAAFGALPLVSGAAFVAFSLAHGAMYLGLKTEGEARALARRSLGRVWPASALLTALFLALVAFERRSGSSAGFIAGTIASAAGLAGVSVFRAKSEKLAFAASFLQAAGVFVATGSSQYPMLVADSADPAASLTIYSAAAPDYTLRLLAVVAVLGLAIAGIYTVFLYAIFKGRVRPSDFYHDKDMEADMTKEKSLASMIVDALAGEKKLVRCRICGYIMAEGDLKDVCPACGVSAKVFEPYANPVEKDRAFLLKLDIHPIIVHAPQAITLVTLILALVSLVATGWRPAIFTSIGVLAWILPISLVLAFGSGLFDGKIRFKKTTTRLLKRKMLLAGTFFAASLGMLYFADAAGKSLGNSSDMAVFIAFNLLGFAMSALLGLIGASLVHAVFVKLGVKKPAAKE